MSTGTGALLLFGAVQLTMISVGLFNGERFKKWQWLGFVLAFLGLVILLLPSAAAPPLLAGAVMVLAGMAWGVYSLLGKKSSSALLSTSGNFVYAAFFCVPLVGVVCFVGADNFVLDSEGVYYALASGVFASGCGYAIWYSALPLIKSTTAATVQLSVPVIASLMGFNSYVGWHLLGYKKIAFYTLRLKQKKRYFPPWRNSSIKFNGGALTHISRLKSNI